MWSTLPAIGIVLQEELFLFVFDLVLVFEVRAYIKLATGTQWALDC